MVMVSLPVFAASHAFLPPPGKTLLFIGQDRDTIAHYVAGMGHVPGGNMLYTSIQKIDGLDSVKDYGSGPMDGTALLNTYPNSVLQIGLYMVGGLDQTLDGTYDDNLRKLAQWIKDANRPVYLRIGYEFDNPANDYDPALYQHAYRYVVDFLRKEGVTNAAYVWHTQCNEGTQWMDWYPGNDYVDWFGVSIYSSQQIPTASHFLRIARKHGKPLMICESSTWGLYTLRAKMDWFNHLFRFIDGQKIGAFCYIDSDWDKLPMYVRAKIGDARVEENGEIKKLWLDEIEQDRYLKASPELFRLLGWGQ